MKNNNVKKIAGRTKLFSAIGMFTVSAVMLASSTYAWFTMNKAVTVTGMQMKTVVMISYMNGRKALYILLQYCLAAVWEAK